MRRFIRARSAAGRRHAPRRDAVAVVEPLERRTLLSVAGQDPSLVAWFDAGAIAAASGSPVATWADATGDGYTATQVTAARRPTYVARAIGTRPAVRFDAAAATQLAFSRPLSGDFTITVVFRSTQGLGAGPLWYTGAGLVDGEVAGVTNDFGLTLDAQGQVLAGTGKPDVTAASNLGFNDGRPHVATFTRSSTSGAIDLYVDGVLMRQATGATGALTASPRLTIGSVQVNNNYFTGDIADVRVYSTVLSDPARAAVESSLQLTYGITAPPARTFTNPVINANFPDPGVLRVGGTYYAFATNGGGRTVPEITSTDLVHWSASIEALPALPSWAKAGRTWAPYAARAADNVHYNLYYTAWSKTDGRQHVGVAQSATPGGPYTAVGSTPLVDQAALGGAIDPSVFTDSGGVRYLLWKNDGNAIGQPTNLYVQQLATDGLSLIGSPTALIHNDKSWEGAVTEAPELVKHDGKYYLFYSANNYANASYAIGYAVSASSIYGPYTKPGGAWVQSTGGVVGPGGESFTIGPDGNLWMLYHSWENNFAYRSMSVDQVTWDGDVPVLRGPSRAGQAVPLSLRPAPALLTTRTDRAGAHASGSLTSTASTTFVLQFFAAVPGVAQPAAFVGAARLTTDAAGQARFVDVALGDVPIGRILTVIATDPAGEFSAPSIGMTVHYSGDINGDDAVDFNDLVLLAQHYDTAAAPALGDINGDGRADFNDLVILAQHYNTSAPPAPAGSLTDIASLAQLGPLFDKQDDSAVVADDPVPTLPRRPPTVRPVKRAGAPRR